jgi:hypothetical protein
VKLKVEFNLVFRGDTQELVDWCLITRVVDHW